jgi:hypothetical protein
MRLFLRKNILKIRNKTQLNAIFHGVFLTSKGIFIDAIEHL